ncbi:Zinc finger protein [Oopsacas minuta]|uniref:Zinc finger protein n=1 Tax=Oopsacas minuta TaxID=111878 RepID=A0AAV7K330_9METZ|nr:Zinc finger protein [Oopsacas minuta]
MCRLRSNLKDRLRDGFYWFKVNQCSPKLQAREQVRFKDEANRVFQRIISYLDKWFDYEGSIYKHIQILNLNREEITFDELTKIASHFQIKINGDDMYNEFCWLREWRVKQRENVLPSMSSG